MLTGSSRGEHDDLTTDASIEGDAFAHLSVLSGHPRWSVATSPKWHLETIPWCPGLSGGIRHNLSPVKAAENAAKEGMILECR